MDYVSDVMRAREHKRSLLCQCSWHHGERRLSATARHCVTHELTDLNYLRVLRDGVWVLQLRLF